MKGIKINKRPIKRITARHMAIAKRVNIEPVIEMVQIKEEPIKDNEIPIETEGNKTTKEVSTPKKSKKTADKKEKNNEENK